MKLPTFAPIYVGLYPVLAKEAQRHGYALAVHGSCSRDLDLIAVPWTEEASSAQALWEALQRVVRVNVGDAQDGAGRPLATPADRPHGRRSWCIPLGCGAVLDLSVMPLAEPSCRLGERVSDDAPAAPDAGSATSASVAGATDPLHLASRRIPIPAPNTPSPQARRWSASVFGDGPWPAVLSAGDVGDEP